MWRGIDNRHKNIYDHNHRQKRITWCIKCLKGDVISWSKDDTFMESVDTSRGDAPADTQPTEGWTTRTPARPILYTHHEDHNITLNVRLWGRRALYNHQSRGRPSIRPLTFPNKSRYHALPFLFSAFHRFAKVIIIKLEELTFGAASCLPCCRHHRLLVAWYNYEHIVVAIILWCTLNHGDDWEFGESKRFVAHGADILPQTGATPESAENKAIWGK